MATKKDQPSGEEQALSAARALAEEGAPWKQGAPWGLCIHLASPHPRLILSAVRSTYRRTSSRGD